MFSRLVNRFNFAQLWWAALVVKLGLAVWLPMSLDECYYWVWGAHPQLSYFDHPGMVGWIFSIGRLFSFIPGQSARIPGVIIGHLTFVVWNEIIKPYLNDGSRRMWFLLVCLSPLWGLASLVQTPDVPFLFFWSLSVWALLRAVPLGDLRYYALLGASLGLGFCSKYHVVLFIPAVLAWLLFDRESLRKVRWSGVALTVLVGLIFCSPVLIWNAQHDFASFRFQISHGLKNHQDVFMKWPLHYVGDQVLIAFPTFFYFAFRARPKNPLRALHAFAWVPFVFFFFTAFRARVEANWPIAAQPELLTLGFWYAYEHPLRLRWLKGTAVAWLLAFVVLLSQILHPWLPGKGLKTDELKENEVFIQQARDLAPLYGSTYQIASYVSYRLNREVNKLYGMDRTDFFDFYPPSHPSGQSGEDHFYVLMAWPVDLPDWAKADGYEVVRKIEVPGGGAKSIYEVRRRAKTSDSDFSSLPIFRLRTVSRFI